MAPRSCGVTENGSVWERVCVKQQYKSQKAKGREGYRTGAEVIKNRGARGARLPTCSSAVLRSAVFRHKANYFPSTLRSPAVAYTGSHALERGTRALGLPPGQREVGHCTHPATHNNPITSHAPAATQFPAAFTSCLLCPHGSPQPERGGEGRRRRDSITGCRLPCPWCPLADVFKLLSLGYRSPYRVYYIFSRVPCLGCWGKILSS